MNLVISLDVNNISLILKDGRKVVDEFAWADEYTLSEKLLPNIDELLERNNVSRNDVKKVTTRISKTSGVTSSRIVQTVAKAWNAASMI